MNSKKFTTTSPAYRQSLNALNAKADPENGLTPERHERLLRDLLRVARQTAVGLRNQGRISDETLRQLERELDLRAAQPTRRRVTRMSHVLGGLQDVGHIPTQSFTTAWALPVTFHAGG